MRKRPGVRTVRKEGQAKCGNNAPRAALIPQGAGCTRGRDCFLQARRTPGGPACQLPVPADVLPWPLPDRLGQAAPSSVGMQAVWSRAQEGQDGPVPDSPLQFPL